MTSRHAPLTALARRRFLRDSTTPSSHLSWEDNLALKYYNSLFREFAIANLKHYKSGQIALRWRTEAEVLAGVGHLTCASLRCPHHAPLPALAAAFEDDPESEAPLVEAALDEYEVPFGYVEEGERKECLVKVVLCGEDGRRLMVGRRRAKRAREEGGSVEKVEGARSEEKDVRRSIDREVGRREERTGREASSRPRESSSRRRSASPPTARRR